MLICEDDAVKKLWLHQKGFAGVVREVMFCTQQTVSIPSSTRGVGLEVGQLVSIF
jgi:hypothetical protein